MLRLRANAYRTPNLGPDWVQFGSNKDFYWLFSAQMCFVRTAKLLKIRPEAFSQRGGQRFDPAQLHQRINKLRAGHFEVRPFCVVVRVVTPVLPSNPAAKTRSAPCWKRPF